MLGSNLGVLTYFPTLEGVIMHRLLALKQEKQHNGALKKKYILSSPVSLPWGSCPPQEGAAPGPGQHSWQ